MSAQALFERLAEETWERLSHAAVLKLRLGEEGLTDFLLLEIMRHRFDFQAGTQVYVKKTTKRNERHFGTDWEWWVGGRKLGWIRYAIQAKVIDVETGRYLALGHMVHGTQQVVLLENYAAAVGALPIYCFYNSAEKDRGQSLWQCCRSGDFTQLGCSVTNSGTIRKALAKRGSRNFRYVHRQPQTLPWRCLVSCPACRDPNVHPLRAPDKTARFWYRDAPRFHLRVRASPKRQELTSSEGQLFWPEGVDTPKRIMITELEE